MLPLLIGVGIGAAFILAGCSDEESPDSSSHNSLRKTVPPPPSRLPEPYRFGSWEYQPRFLQSMAVRLLVAKIPVAELDRGTWLFYPWEEAGERAPHGNGDFTIGPEEVSMAVYRRRQADSNSPAIQELYREIMRDPSIRLQVGRQLLMSPQRSPQDLSSAGHLLEDLVREDPSRSEYRQALGHWHRVQGARSEALRQYILADDASWLGSGGESSTLNLLRELNEGSEASRVEEWLRRIREEHPNSPCARHFMGRWQELNHRDSAAILAYEETLALESEAAEPNYVFLDSRRRLIGLLLATERYREADRQFRKLDELDLDSEDLDRQARALRGLGRIAEARSMQRQAAQLRSEEYPSRRSAP